MSDGKFFAALMLCCTGVVLQDLGFEAEPHIEYQA
jgi:hypothetical protein